MDSGARLSPVDHRLSDLWRAQRREIQRAADLPRADRRPACRRTCIRSPAARDGGRRWSVRASRSTPTASSSSAPTCSAAAWARPARRRSIRETGEPYGLDFPVVTIADMVRAQALLIDHLGIDTLFCVAGGSMGGMQVLQWAAAYPERVFAAMPIATAARPLVAEHRLPRGRPAGDHGRPRLARRPLSCRAHAAVQGARGRAHGGAHHLSLGQRAAPAFRPQPAGPRGPDLLVRRGFPGRIVPAPSGADLRRAVRPELLPLSDARDGLFRSRRRLRRLAGQCVQGVADPLLRRLVHLRLAVPDQRFARDRARAQRRRRVGFVRRDRDRQRARRLPARRARNCIETTRGFIDAAARARGIA